MAWFRTTLLLLMLAAAAAAAGVACLPGAPADAPPHPATPRAGTHAQPVARTASGAGGERIARAPSPAPAAGVRSPVRAAPPDVVVRGRVVDATGSAAEGARVVLWPRDGGARDPVCAVAGPDGGFRLQVAAALPFVAVLRAEGTATPPIVVARCIAAAVVDVGELVLTAAGELVGSIVGADGAAVGGAEVRLVAVSGALAALPDRLRERAAGETTTGPDGGFAFRRLPPGAYAVEVAAAGCARQRTGSIAVPAGARTVLPPLALCAGHELGGTVVGPGGEPAAAALVGIAPCDGSCELLQATTDAHGRFAFARLPAGPFVVQVVAGGHAPLVCAGVEPAPDLVLRLEPGARIRGVVAGRDRACGALRVRVRRVDDLPDSPVAIARRELGARIGAANVALANVPDDRAALAELAAVASARRDLERRHALFLPHASVRLVDVDGDGAFACDGLASGIYVLEAVGVGGAGPTAAEVFAVAGAEAFVSLVAPVRSTSAAR